jgi:hypothetical protein
MGSFRFAVNMREDGEAWQAVMRDWHEFYTLAGTASATLVGLLFVAASVGSGTWSRRAALRVFLSATVVHFSSVLLVSLCVMAPLPGVALGGLIAAVGLVGLAYCASVLRDMIRDGLAANIDLEDRTWYAALPIMGYLAMVGSGVALALAVEFADMAVAASVAVLLVAGIRNAWDITIWLVTRQRN